MMMRALQDAVFPRSRHGQGLLPLVVVVLFLGGCASTDTALDYLASLKANVQMIYNTTQEPMTRKLSEDSIRLVDKVKAAATNDAKLIETLKQNEDLKKWMNILIFGSVILTSLGMAFSFFISWKVGLFLSTIGVINVVLAVTLTKYLWLIGLIGVAMFMCFGLYFAYEFYRSKKAAREIVTDLEAVKDIVPGVKEKLKAITTQSPSTQAVVEKIQAGIPTGVSK